jgi:hypothetical protein
VILFLNVAFALTYDYVARLKAFDGANGRWLLHDEIVARQAQDPYRYRVLVPGGVEVLQKLGLASDDGAGLDRLYGLYFLLSLFAILLATRWLLGSLGFDRGHALAGALLVGALLPISLRDHGFQPWSWLEAVTVVLAMALTLRAPRPWLFVALMVVATLNRETSVFLPALAVAAALVHRREPRLRNRWLLTAVLGYAAWGVTRGFVYLVVGRADSRAISVEEIFAMNTGPGAARRTAEVFLLLLAGVLLCAVLAAVTRRLSPWMFWTALVGVPQYLAGWLVFAVWWEVRVLVPALLLLVPAALAAMVPRGGGAPSGATDATTDATTRATTDAVPDGERTSLGAGTTTSPVRSG